MNVKIDTKEKFVIIKVLEHDLAANMTGEIHDLLVPYMQKVIPNIIVNLSSVNSIDDKCSESLAAIQQVFYENSCSLVICELQPGVEAKLDELGLLEILNVTPTESEAWDIVQMEELERELLSDEELPL